MYGGKRGGGKTTAAYVNYDILILIASVYVHEQPSGGVGGVGDVVSPQVRTRSGNGDTNIYAIIQSSVPGKLIYDPSIDCTETNVAPSLWVVKVSPQPRYVFYQPMYLRTGKVGSEG